MHTATDSVRLALFDVADTNYFLVAAETDDPENFKLTGGRFDTVDETPRAAVIRELREELGVDSESIGLKQAGRLLNDDGTSARYIFAGLISRAAVRETHEIAAVQWVTVDTIPAGKNQAHIRSAVELARTVL